MTDLRGGWKTRFEKCVGKGQLVRHSWKYNNCVLDRTVWPGCCYCCCGAPSSLDKTEIFPVASVVWEEVLQDIDPARSRGPISGRKVDARHPLWTKQNKQTETTHKLALHWNSQADFKLHLIHNCLLRCPLLLRAEYLVSPKFMCGSPSSQCDGVKG